MIKVLIVDDSQTAIEMISSILTTSPDIEIIGSVYNGREAINFLQNQTVKPDIICADINMPVMNGFDMIQYIMDKIPLPILVVTYLDKDENFMKALDLGALDLIQKPGPDSWQELPKMGIELIEKVRLLSRVKVIRHMSSKRINQGANNSKITEIKYEKHIDFKLVRKIICIASSTGGPNTLLKLLKLLPDEFNIPVFIVQHMTESFFIKGMVEWFQNSLNINILLASDGDEIKSNTIYVAPANNHLLIKGNKMILDDSPPVKRQKPSADLLFQSAAESFGKNTIAIVLTGIGDDGASGAQCVSRKGGVVYAQNEESSIVFGMPSAAIQTHCVEKVLSVEGIAEELLKIAY